MAIKTIRQIMLSYHIITVGQVFKQEVAPRW